MLSKFISILLLICILITSGCASMTDKTVTTLTDGAGNVTETVATANTTKTISLYNAHVGLAKHSAAVNKNAGFNVDIYGLSKTENANGDPVYFAQVKISNKPVVVIQNKLPERIPDHWSKEVAIQAFKYGFYAYGTKQLTEIVAGVSSGMSIDGDNNVIQGSQNKAGNDQEVRSDYVTCASGNCGSDPEEYYVDGKCYVSEGCSCDSYAAGLCK